MYAYLTSADQFESFVSHKTKMWKEDFSVFLESGYAIAPYCYHLNHPYLFQHQIFASS
jgi:hypothetical protein